MFSDHYVIKLEINNRKASRYTQNLEIKYGTSKEPMCQRRYHKGY